jgi:hypothetical protein
MVSSFSQAQLTASLDGDTVRIWDANVEIGCAAKFFPLYRQSNDTLYLVECDTALHAPCICIYSLCTSLTGLVPGDYVAVVTREYRKYFSWPDSFHISYSISAGSVSFSVIHASSPSITFFQSPCMGSTEVLSEDPSSRAAEAGITAYPNPFNPSITIEFRLARPAGVRLSVYTVSGQEVFVLLNRHLQEGTHRIPFNAHGLSSGTYICHLRCADELVTTKLLSLR